ncbi:MAG: hypothetical protein CL674_16600 [Bdellovibrionaceae bacterium]|nr:hypothetical protein [Pseudobdellovibrionaceae bacterium]|tara:strand:+ start:2728 stop:3486 length:759 start_codon:yes stop_codon:yes gene_type:complete
MKYVDEYLNWLKRSIRTRDVNGWTEITTPYLDRHNDWIQIYVKETKGIYVLTDDSYTILDLENSGCVLDSPKRKSLLSTTLSGFGVRLNGNALVIEASAEDLPFKKHSLMQAMLAVNDLFYVSRASVDSLFYEDVVYWLEQNNVRYTENVSFTGKSGMSSKFNFVIPKSPKEPERILHLINSPSKSIVQATIFSWEDIKFNRKSDSVLYAMVNDSDESREKVAQKTISPFKNYGIVPILSSEKDLFIDRLAS